MGAGPALAEEVEGLVPELAAENAKGPRRVAEAAGDLAGGKLFEEKSAQGFVLALGGGLRFKEEPGFFC